MRRILLVIALLVSLAVAFAQMPTATCVGADPCKACKNCKYCKHCSKSGGKCGVCKKQ
jgi:hypothetical protein